MTHKDIYTKFMIEYDKANVTSSYPSLTEYEVATLLDKAYLALISQKVTGNNLRAAALETDIKAISDLAPLIVHKDITLFRDQHQPAINIVQYKLPTDFMYYVSSALNQTVSANGQPMDQNNIRFVPSKLVSHNIAEKFFNSPQNMPWVKTPVSYIEGDTVFVVYDPINKPNVANNDTAHLSYIKKPASFVGNLQQVADPVLPEPTPDTNSSFTLNISDLDGNDTLG